MGYLDVKKKRKLFNALIVNVDISHIFMLSGPFIHSFSHNATNTITVMYYNYNSYTITTQSRFSFWNNMTNYIQVQIQVTFLSSDLSVPTNYNIPNFF